MNVDRCVEDATLVRRARTGDVTAFTELVSAYRGYAHSVAHSYCGSYEDAGDIAQEAFVTAYTKLDQLREPESFGAWFMSIVRSRALSWLHQRRRRRDIAPFQPYDEHPNCFADAALNVHRLDQRNDDLWDAVHELPEMYREVLLLHYWKNYSYNEISDLLDLPCTTVKGRLQQSRRRLRERIAGPATRYESEFYPLGRRVHDYDLHEPTGRIAFTWVTGDDQVGLTVSELDTGDVVREVDKLVAPHYVRFSPDGETIAFAAEGDRGRVAVWTCRLDDGRLDRLIDEPDEVANFPVWRPDGNALAYFRSRRQSDGVVRGLLEGDFGLYEFELATGRSTPISDADHKPMHRFYVAAKWTGDGNRVAYQSLIHEYRDYRTSVMMADRKDDGTWRVRGIPAEAGEEMTLSHTAWSPDGECIAVITGPRYYMGPRTVRVLDATSLVQLWAYTDERLTDVGFERDGRHLWCSTEREFLRFAYPGGAIVDRLPLMGLGRYHQRELEPNVVPSADGNALWFLAADARARKWQFGDNCDTVDLPASELDDLGPVPHRIDDEAFAARDGQAIPVHRYVPPSPRDLAVCVVGSVTPKWIVARLLRGNYEVVSVRPRRQLPGFSWDNWADDAGVIDALDAIDAAVDWKMRHGSGRKMAVLGHRFGGFLAFRAMREPDSPFACGVTLNALTDIEGAGDGWLVRLDPAERDEKIRERCPIEHAGEIRSPLLMIHGTRDTARSADLATIAERVRGSGHRCDLLLYNDTHLLLKHRDEAVGAMVGFLRDHK